MKFMKLVSDGGETVRIIRIDAIVLLEKLPREIVFHLQGGHRISYRDRDYEDLDRVFGEFDKCLQEQ